MALWTISQPLTGYELPDPKIDDEHIRNAQAPPLCIQEGEANVDLSQVYHSNEESLLPGSQSILTSTGKPVAWLSQKRRSGQEEKKERLLAEATSEILRHEYRADLPDNSIRKLNGQIEYQATELGIVSRDMNRPDEYTIYFMKNWQNDIEHLVKLLSGVIMKWQNWRELMN